MMEEIIGFRHTIQTKKQEIMKKKNGLNENNKMATYRQ